MTALHSSKITVASRLMLPVDLGFFAVLGIVLLSTPEVDLKSTPTFAFADTLVDLSAWGVGFMLLTFGLTVAFIMENGRELARWVLSVAVLWLAAFAIVALVAAIKGDATYAAWAWPAYVSFACLASTLSLGSGEVGEPR
jgi:hypothetical protein